MHICFITATMAGGGTERVIAVLSNYFIKQDNDITVLLTADHRVEYDLDPKVELIQLGGKTGGKLCGRIKRIWTLRRYLRKHKDTVYLSFGTETNMFLILSAFLMRRKIIISERNDPNKCDFVGKRDLLYPYAKGYIFQTEDAKNCFSEEIQKRSMVIPNPVSDKVPERYIGIRRKEIVAVGRLEEQKNHKLLLESFAEFSKAVPGYTLKIYGKGYLKQELTEYADKLGLGSSTIFADFAPDVLEQIKDSAMYILSSDYEGISNSLLEALALGIPVVSTDCPIGGSRLLIKDHENGILVPVGDKEALTAAMKEIAENSRLADSFSIEGEKIKAQYSVERIAEMWQQMISQV